jgi:hypothetical protein
VQFFVRLVLEGTSLRGAARVGRLLVRMLCWTVKIPHWTTVRRWLQRLGHARLTQSLTRATDWAWLIDHSVQIGQEKCLVILGIRLSDLPARGKCLRHEHMRLIALIPRKSWTRPEVDDQLEIAASRTGPPRVIVDDRGVDLSGGVSLFQQRHPETLEIYDLKHKAACLLKARLERDPRWKAFYKKVGETRCAIQQTELAFLVPPGPRPKARFMNLESLLRWGRRVQAILAMPERMQSFASRERFQVKLGWLIGFENEMEEWSAWQEVVNTAVVFVNRNGLFQGADDELRGQFPSVFASVQTQQLAEELLAFVAAQSSKARPGERLPGSTEVLESCFGRFKVLERNHSRGGFTGLVLAFGALVGRTTNQVLDRALRLSHTHDVTHWCHKMLGSTLFTKRRLAWQLAVTETG